MKLLPKVMLTTTLVGILGLSGLAARASTKYSIANSLIPQRSNATQVAEASDGDGEMNDAVETQLEKKTSQGNAPTQAATSAEANSNQTEKISQDKNDRLGENDAQEGSEKPNDIDGGKNEDLETH